MNVGFPDVTSLLTTYGTPYGTLQGCHKCRFHVILVVTSNRILGYPRIGGYIQAIPPSIYGIPSQKCSPQPRLLVIPERGDLHTQTIESNEFAHFESAYFLIPSQLPASGTETKTLKCCFFFCVLAFFVFPSDQCTVYVPFHLLDFCGFHAGKYTIH